MHFSIKDMNFFEDGTIQPLSEYTLMILLNNGVDCDQITIDENYVSTIEKFKLNIPSIYRNIDIDEFFNKYTNNDIKHNARIKYELELCRRANTEDLFRQIIYIKDYLDNTNVTYGVGRGSSCASYLLYLLGIHLVNALEYDIHPSEFFKLS